MNREKIIRNTIYLIVCVWLSSCSLTRQESVITPPQILSEKLTFYDGENGDSYPIPLSEILALNFSRETSFVQIDSTLISLYEIKGFVNIQGNNYHLKIEKISSHEGNESLIGCTLSTPHQDDHVLFVSYLSAPRKKKHYVWMEPNSRIYSIVDGYIERAFQLHLEDDKLKDKRPICEYLESETFKKFTKKLPRPSPRPKQPKIFFSKRA